jgi:hypothetical protein
MVRSHTSELLAPPRPRNACDRCHSQKLRCLKTPDGDTCLRCAKFGTQCLFSTRAPRRKTQQKSSDGDTRRQSEAHCPLHMGHNLAPSDVMAAPTPPDAWPPASLSTALESFNFTSADLLGIPNFTGSPVHYQPWDCHIAPAYLQEAPRTVADAVCDLADLNVKLLDHAATLPPPLNSSSPSAQPGDKLFAIDQTFTLTKRLIGILKDLYSGLGQEIAADRYIDQATVLLFMSCYYRLTDIYESIFVHLRGCAQSPLLPIPNEGVVKLPLLQIGSYIPTQMPKTEPGSSPPISALSMHMMLILILSTHLCEQLGDVIATSVSHAQGGDMVLLKTKMNAAQGSLHRGVDFAEVGLDRSGFDDMARKAMWKRTNELDEQMRLTKQALMHFSLASL